MLFFRKILEIENKERVFDNIWTKLCAVYFLFISFAVIIIHRWDFIEQKKVQTKNTTNECRLFLKNALLNGYLIICSRTQTYTSVNNTYT